MAGIREYKEAFLERIQEYAHKNELAKTVGPDYYEPGMMENLEQYYSAEIDPNNYVIRVDVKGLRYELRSQRLTECHVGDSVTIERDYNNEYNSNNYNVKLSDGFHMGMLPANLCNVLAPLYDAGFLIIEEAKICYIEQLLKRSRYAKQGIMFVEMRIRIRGV